MFNTQSRPMPRNLPLPPVEDTLKTYGLFCGDRPVMNQFNQPFTGTRGKMNLQRITEEHKSVGGNFYVKEIV